LLHALHGVLVSALFCVTILAYNLESVSEIFFADNLKNSNELDVELEKIIDSIMQMEREA